jgi:AsmA protein
MNRRLLFGLIAGGVAIALLAAAYLSLPLFLSTVSLKGEIEARVAHATGRAFRIRGPLTITLFPSLGITARDVALANAPGGTAKDMVHIDALHLAVRLWPLLHRRIEATRVVLEHPQINLEVDAAGRGNWELVQRRAEESGLRLPAGTVFSGAAIQDGRVSYDNAKLDIQRTLEKLDAEIDITTLGEPVKAHGTFVHHGKAFRYTATVATIRTLLSGVATKVDVALDADIVHAAFLGFLSSDGTAKGNGALITPSVKNLAAWLGRPVEAGSGLGALTALADIAAKDRRVSLSRIKAKLDGMAVGGSLVADMSATTPDVTANLTVDHIDLNTYLHIGEAPRSAAPAATGPPSGGWSKAPIKLDLLKLLNGHLNIAVGSLAVRHLHLGPTRVAAVLDGGALQAHLDPITLYGGHGTAFLSVDGSGVAPILHNTLTFSGIAMRPFLTDAIGVDKLDGTGTIALDVSSAGASPDAIMRAMSGRGSVAIVHGRVRGVDMGQVARTVQTILSAGATGGSATTDFDSFSGAFVIRGGILNNDNLSLSSAYLHMTGRGALNLGNQTIAYRIEPKASIGGRMNLLDVGVPFTIYGSWAHLHYVPDLTGAVTGLVGSMIDKGTAPIAGLLGGLTGGAPTGKPKPGPKPKSVGDTLKGIFGLH